MTKIFILCLMMLSVTVYSVDDGFGLNSDSQSETQASVTGSNNSVYDDCYKLINDKKYEEALFKANSFKNSHDKVNIYISVGMTTSDKDLYKSIISSLKDFQSQEEGLDYLTDQINQIEFMHMTVSEKLVFIKTQENLNDVFNLLRINHDVLLNSDDAVMVYDYILRLMPRKPLESDLNNILTVLSYVKHDSLSKKEKDIFSFVFNTSKRLEFDSQLNFLISLTYYDSQQSDIYTNRIKKLYADSDVLGQLKVATHLCYNKNLSVFTQSDYVSLEDKVNIEIKKNTTEYRYLYGLIGLAQCQGDTQKMTQLVSKLPKDQQSRFVSPD